MSHPNTTLLSDSQFLVVEILRYARIPDVDYTELILTNEVMPMMKQLAEIRDVFLPEQIEDLCPNLAELISFESANKRMVHFLELRRAQGIAINVPIMVCSNYSKICVCPTCLRFRKEEFSLYRYGNPEAKGLICCHLDPCGPLIDDVAVELPTKPSRSILGLQRYPRIAEFTQKQLGFVGS